MVVVVDVAVVSLAIRAVRGAAAARDTLSIAVIISVTVSIAFVIAIAPSLAVALPSREIAIQGPPFPFAVIIPVPLSHLFASSPTYPSAGCPHRLIALLPERKRLTRRRTCRGGRGGCNRSGGRNGPALVVMPSAAAAAVVVVMAAMMMMITGIIAVTAIRRR